MGRQRQTLFLLALLLLPLVSADICKTISTSGSHTLTSNVDGADQPDNSCIRITADDVVFDCKGFNITCTSECNNTQGISIRNANSNITIKNCPGISGFTQGVNIESGNNIQIHNSTSYGNTNNGFALSSSTCYSTISNSTAHSNGANGFYLDSHSHNISVSSNNAHSNGANGFYFVSSSDNEITENLAYNQTSYGFAISNSSGNNLTRNIATGNSRGVFIVSSSGNLAFNNTANSNQDYGFVLDMSYNNLLSSNIASNNSRDGFHLSWGGGNLLFNNTAHYNFWHGFFLYPSSNNTLSKNTAQANSQYGFVLFESYNNTLSGNLACNNTIDGFIVHSSSNNSLLENTAKDNKNSGFSVQFSTNSTLSGNIAQENGESGNHAGFRVYLGSNITLSDNLAQGNSRRGFYLDSTSEATLYNNTAHGNTYYGFHIIDTEDSSLSENTAYNNEFYGFHAFNSINITISGSTAHNNIAGFYITENSDYNKLYGNTAHSNQYGIAMESTSFSTFQGNTAHSNTEYGLYLGSAADHNVLSNTAIYGNGNYGIFVSSSENNTFSNTLIYGQESFLFSTDAGTTNNFTIQEGTTSVFFPTISYGSNSALNASTLRAGSGFVSLDSEAVPSFNTSATITMDIGTCEGFEPSKLFRAEGFHTSKEGIISAGSPCPGKVCTSVQCEGGILTFNVPHFTGYAYGSLANLTIDNNGPAVEGQEISFNASYVNSTSGQHIAGATCTLGLQNGSTYPMGEFASYYESNITAFVPGTHNYNVTCSAAGFDTLTAFDTYQVLGGAPNATITVYAANVTIINTSKYFSNLTAGNITTEGGNISAVNLNSSRSTEKWAGFYGNTTGSLILSEHNASVFMYKWAWDSTLGGTVCVSTNSTLYTFQAAGASASEIGTAWGFSPTDTDSAENTYNGTGCTINFGQANVSGASYAQTGTSGDFRTCALRSAISPSKPEMLFCANITSAGQLFNGRPGDFELIAPTAQEPGAFETYYFYMSLN